MNVPKLRFPEFKGEWEEKRINDYAECRAGATPDTKNSDYWDNGTIPWMSSGEVNNKFIYSTEKKITQLGYDKSSTQLLPINTVVIALAGQGKTRGTVAITKTEVCTNQSLCGILNSSELNSEYLFQFLSSQYKQLRASSTGGDESRGGLNLQIIGNFRLPYTSFDEQQKIADFLSNVDSIITAETKILNTLQKKKKALMQKLFTQQLRFKSNDGTDFPAWEEKKLGDVCEVTKLAGFEFTEYVRYKDSGKIIALRGLNVKNGRLVLDDVKYIDDSNLDKLSRSKLYKNDILFTYIGTVGQVAVIHEDNRYYLAPNVSRLRIKDTNLISSFLMYQLSDLRFYKKRIYPLIASSSQPALSMENIRLFKIQVPSKSEQQKIADCLSSMDSLIQTQQKVVTTWQQRKKALLQQMFI